MHESGKGNYVTEAEFEGSIRRICAGDKNGLKEIYEAYFPYLYSVILGIVKTRENAEDITSDFFIKLWSLAESYKPGNGHKGYLATIARNMAIDFIRKQKKEVLMAGFDENPDGDQPQQASLAVSDEVHIGSEAAALNEQSPEKQVVAKLSMQETLSRLKPAEQEIINLKVMGELTFQEISDVLGQPMGTVTWRYREAINKLRRCGYE